MANKVKTWIPPTIPLRDDLPAWKILFQDVHDNLIEAGLVQTADTGQLDFDSVTALPTDGSYAGYRMYELNDAMSATHPVYIKIEFGCGSEGLWNIYRSRTPRIWHSISTSTDGAGNVSNASSRFGDPQWLNQSSGTVTSQLTHTGTSVFCKNDDLGFFGFFYGIGSRNKPFSTPSGTYIGCTLAILIQRTSGGIGTYHSRLTTTNNSYPTGLNTSAGQFISYSGGVTPLSNDLAFRYLNERVLFGDDIFLQPIFMETPEGLKQFPTIASYSDTSIPVFTTFELEVEEGSSRTFIALGNETGISIQPVGANASIAMLYQE